MEGAIWYSLSDELALKEEAKMAAVGKRATCKDIVILDADNIRWQIHLYHPGWLDGYDLRFHNSLWRRKLKCKWYKIAKMPCS